MPKWNTGMFQASPSRPELPAARMAYHQAVGRSALSSPEQVADSVAKLKKLIDDDPENARLWYVLGRLREHQSDFEKAKKCYDKAVSINPLIDPDLKAGLVRIGAPAPADATATAQTRLRQRRSRKKLCSAR